MLILDWSTCGLRRLQWQSRKFVCACFYDRDQQVLPRCLYQFDYVLCYALIRDIENNFRVLWFCGFALILGAFYIRSVFILRRGWTRRPPGHAHDSNSYRYAVSSWFRSPNWMQGFNWSSGTGGLPNFCRSKTAAYLVNYPSAKTAIRMKQKRVE